MSETKFTPGPWKVTVSENGIDVGVDGLDGETITGWIEPYDAHLIAAAPDMYMVLEEVFDEVENYMERTGRSVTWGEKAKAALAKARGEA